MQVSKIRLNNGNMTFPKTTSDTFNHNDYDDIQTLLGDVLGIGENGYGLALIRSSPIEIDDTVTALEWNNLVYDTNILHQHITNTTTSTPYVSTGSSVITAASVNELYATNTWLYDDSRRYTCHPSQFAISTGTSVLFYPGGDSLRTLPWGVDTNAITHKVVSQFANRLSARYYFNIGSYLTLTPYYQGIGVNDLDAEWANFIDYLRQPANQFIYDRRLYNTYSSTTTAWTSGTLHVSIDANRSADLASIEFVTTYSNNANPDLLITPAVGIYNITL